MPSPIQGCASVGNLFMQGIEINLGSLRSQFGRFWEIWATTIVNWDIMRSAISLSENMIVLCNLTQSHVSRDICITLSAENPRSALLTKHVFIIYLAYRNIGDNDRYRGVAVYRATGFYGDNGFRCTTALRPIKGRKILYAENSRYRLATYLA